MAWTQSALDELEKAYRSGIRTVRYPDGTEVTYDTRTQMRRMIAEAEAELAGRTTRRRVSQLSGSSGLR
jgi:hypothetical protein